MTDLLTSAGNGEIWVVLLGIGITLVLSTAVAGAFIAWRDRPMKRDEIQENKLHQRLMEITNSSAAPQRKSF